MPDYSKSIIYKIYCKDENVKDFYVGATCHFKTRKSQHKTNCFNKNGLMKYNTPLYCCMRLNGGWNNWIVEKIEQVNCRDKKHRNRIEAQYIKKLGATLNDCIPQDIEEGLEVKEWFEKYQKNNKEEIFQKKKQYRENNKEEIFQKKKQYRENNKEEIAQKKKQYYENNKEKLLERKKEYYENNKEEIAQNNKQYRENNKEEIAKKKKEKYKCACGSILTINHKSRHERSKKHQDYINSPEPNLIFRD